MLFMWKWRYVILITLCLCIYFLLVESKSFNQISLNALDDEPTSEDKPSAFVQPSANNLFLRPGCPSKFVTIQAFYGRTNNHIVQFDHGLLLSRFLNRTFVIPDIPSFSKWFDLSKTSKQYCVISKEFMTWSHPDKAIKSLGWFHQDFWSQSMWWGKPTRHIKVNAPYKEDDFAARDLLPLLASHVEPGIS